MHSLYDISRTKCHFLISEKKNRASCKQIAKTEYQGCQTLLLHYKKFEPITQPQCRSQVSPASETVFCSTLYQQTFIRPSKKFRYKRFYLYNAYVGIINNKGLMNENRLIIKYHLRNNRKQSKKLSEKSKP